MVVHRKVGLKLLAQLLVQCTLILVGHRGKWMSRSNAQ
jgi:hypothetical protein